MADFSLLIGQIVLICPCSRMNIGSEIPIDRLSPHGTQDFTLQEKNPYIPALLDIIKILLNHDRLTFRIGFVGPYIIIDQ